MDAEKQDLPVEEQGDTPAQKSRVPELSDHLSHVISDSAEDREAENWRSLNQQLKALGVRLTHCFVLQFDAAHPEHPGVMKRWVLCEVEPETLHEANHQDEFVERPSRRTDA